MNTNRDDFSAKVKRTLRERAGGKCSNPSCKAETIGPNSYPDKVTIIGEAAHIKAAAPGGARYDSSMTQKERKSIDNGIWLCSKCATLIDKDPGTYTVELLHEWKKLAEDEAETQLRKGSNYYSQQDIELLKFYVQCFDRPAFQDEITQEGSMEDLDKAIEDTIIALGTGVLRTREGEIIKQAQGKTAIKNQLWRKKLDSIYDLLVVLRRQLLLANNDHSYRKTTNPYIDKQFYCFNDRQLVEWLNSTREQIVGIISSMCKEANLPPIYFDRRHYHNLYNY